MSNRVLSFEKILDVPRAAVWRCWTEPDLIVQWFTPKPWRTVSAELDLRPGGSSLIVMRSPDGQDYPNAGVYLDVVAMEKLVFTDAFTSAWVPSGKAYMTAEVSFSDAGEGKTLYRAQVAHWSDEDCASHAARGFYEGWGKAAEQLVDVARTLA